MAISEERGFLARQPAAVDSAFAILEAVDRLGPGTTARQLVSELSMSQASVYRIIKHLVANEYLVRTPDLRGFVIGERVRSLGMASPGRAPSAAASGPIGDGVDIER